jgi:outer membrane receptor for ferrienterochelin and colicin
MARKGTTVFVAMLQVMTIWAQSDANKGSIGGTVVDPKGTSIESATVIVFNPETGLRRQTVTNGLGQYRFSSLDPGAYEVKVEVPTFAATVKEVAVTVGGSVQVAFTVALQTAAESMNLSAAYVSASDSNSSQVLTREAIRDLPIDGRRFQDFATLTPTVQALSETRGQLSFVGQRGNNSNVMVDGADYNEPFVGGIRGGERSNFAFTVPQSAIREFQAVTSGYSADYGRSTGGILNAITRSGGNALHGDLFYQLRHKELGLENPLRQQSLETQHQFGGAIGGPIRKDKLFFFAAAEQQFATFPRSVRFAALDTVANNVTPDIAPAYQYFRSLEGPFSQTNNVTATLGRLDYQFAGGSRLTGRYNYSRNVAKSAVSTGVSLIPQTNSAQSNNGTERDGIHTAVGQFTSVLGPYLINDFRAQYSREENPRTANSFSPNVDAEGIGQFGTGNFLPSTIRDYRLQFADALTLQRGSHAFTLGADYSYIGAFQLFGANQFGAFVITGSDVRATLGILSRSGGPQGNRFDDPNVVYLRQVGNSTIDTNAHQLAFFALDSWRVRPNLTINYGLRWEGQFNPTPVTDNEFLLTNVRDFAFPLGRVNPTVLRNQFDQWAPRAGFAWNVSQDGRTIVRAQTGLYHAQTPLQQYAAQLENFRLPGGDLTLQIAPNGSGTIYQRFKAAGFDFNQTPLDHLPVYSVGDIWMRVAGQPNQFADANVTTTSGDNYRNPRALQMTVGVEHRLADGFVVDYQFNHVNTAHLERVVDYNVPRPVVRPGDLSERPFFGLRSGTLRPNPNLGSVLVLDSNARSNFIGHTFRARYRLRRLHFAAHYTLSYNKSDADSLSLTTTTYQNPFNFHREYNWSDLDARHQLGGYAIYQAPRGIELAGLFHFRSGLPIDASTGQDSSELLTGNAGNRPMQQPGIPFLRNAFRNLDFKSVDLRVLKSYSLREATRLQLSCELFNLFNFQNMAFISSALLANNPGFVYGPGILFNGQAAPIDTRFLRLRNSNGTFDSGVAAQQGTPFQAQLGLRLIF